MKRFTPIVQSKGYKHLEENLRTHGFSVLQFTKSKGASGSRSTLLVHSLPGDLSCNAMRLFGEKRFNVKLRTCAVSSARMLQSCHTHTLHDCPLCRIVRVALGKRLSVSRLIRKNRGKKRFIKSKGPHPLLQPPITLASVSAIKNLKPPPTSKIQLWLPLKFDKHEIRLNCHQKVSTMRAQGHHLLS